MRLVEHGLEAGGKPPVAIRPVIRVDGGCGVLKDRNASGRTAGKPVPATSGERLRSVSRQEASRSAPHPGHRIAIFHPCVRQATAGAFPHGGAGRASIWHGCGRAGEAADEGDGGPVARFTTLRRPKHAFGGHARSGEHRGVRRVQVDAIQGVAANRPVPGVRRAAFLFERSSLELTSARACPWPAGPPHVRATVCGRATGATPLHRAARP